MTDHKIIDNFFPSDAFKKLHDFLLPQLTDIEKGRKHLEWYYLPGVTGNYYMPDSEYANKIKSELSDEDMKEDWRLFYLQHMVYAHTIVSPQLYKEIMPYCSKLLDIKALIRIKINMFPNTETLREHGMHIDYDYPHKAGLFSINTCDGYTKLEDGTKINSVANRMLLFDGSKPHTSSTTTDQTIRVNINFNFF